MATKRAIDGGGEGAPSRRIRALRGVEPNHGGRYVLYWMTAHRRTRSNFSLEHAIEICRRSQRPLVVFEPLRAGYRWASPRFHRFVIEGMRDQGEALKAAGVEYLPYVEPKAGAGQGLLAALARDAVAVVTDDYPAFFHPRMLEAAAEAIDPPLDAVDSYGLCPMRAPDRAFPTAYSFRRYLQNHLSAAWDDGPEGWGWPVDDPLEIEFPRAGEPLAATAMARWGGPADIDALLDGGIAELPIDQSVPAVSIVGGAKAARAALDRFVGERLRDYTEERNRPEADGASGLSPYLHFGHIGAHEVFEAIADAEGWEPTELLPSGNGKRSGWWGMGESAEAFLDQLVTWRELGANGAVHIPEFDRYESLPDWAQETLATHAKDEREYHYSMEEFEQGATHDTLWNAAQNQLRHEGVMHNYLRMLWGKKILEWTASPRKALEVMIHLNNKYALDGRDPNSYSGIFWILGRYDRAWGPERPVFGKIRFMSSQNTARKFPVREYVRRYSSPDLVSKGL